jgi:hypothetical protein
MVAYGNVTAFPFHVPDLSLAEVSKRSISIPTVFVSMLASRCAGDREDQRVLRWRYDAALLLATKLGVDVSASIIGAPNLKVFDGHLAAPCTLRSSNKTCDLSCGEWRSRAGLPIRQPHSQSMERASSNPPRAGKLGLAAPVGAEERGNLAYRPRSTRHDALGDDDCGGFVRRIEQIGDGALEPLIRFTIGCAEVSSSDR